MSSIAVAMSAAGYRQPFAREGCHNCANAEQQGLGQYQRYCNHGGYYVHAHAICKHYEERPAQAAQAAQPEEAQR